MGKHLNITRRGLLRVTAGIAGGAAAAFAIPASVRNSFASGVNTINVAIASPQSVLVPSVRVRHIAEIQTKRADGMAEIHRRQQAQSR
ncbi:hypothetical protein [Rhizobium leguminosarum]|uniref:hypothetical protein n=1 Tax=Rhizobium leguminosarum TaxID=384 RepID=UPI0021BBB7F2|nr:hypothetical protein [Rhizobium leguminosarum]